MTELLKIENLSKTFSSPGGQTRVLKNLNLTVEKNEFICILGPSGCGKSTLVRCIAGFEQYSGTIRCGGKVVSEPSTDRIMVFQDYNQLFPWMTVENNIMYPLRLQGIKDKAELRRVTDEVLRKVGLDSYQKFYPHELSGGMKQRAAIAKALALKPEIILMDEPFAALDAITRNKLQRELNRISADTDITVIFITHNIQEAITLGSRLILLGKNGRIVIDEKNPLQKPITPSMEGYGAMWDMFSNALSAETETEPVL